MEQCAAPLLLLPAPPDRPGNASSQRPRDAFRRTDPPDHDPLPAADAILAAPLTFNTINKWAGGISDTVALGLLNELLVGGPSIVAAPCVKGTFQAHPA